MSETLTPEQRAEARAMKRLKSEGYAKMPSPEVLQKAIGLRPPKKCGDANARQAH